jgi:hypothetical protein
MDERRVFLSQDEVPAGVNILGIPVGFQAVTVVDGQTGQESPIFHQTMVYVELTPAEWEAACGDQQRINALGHQFGGLVQQALGTDWHRWSDVGEPPA